MKVESRELTVEGAVERQLDSSSIQLPIQLPGGCLVVFEGFAPRRARHEDYLERADSEGPFRQPLSQKVAATGQGRADFDGFSHGNRPCRRLQDTRSKIASIAHPSKGEAGNRPLRRDVFGRRGRVLEGRSSWNTYPKRAKSRRTLQFPVARGRMQDENDDSVWEVFAKV